MDKGLAKLTVRAAGLLTADFAVVRNTRDLQRIDLPFPLFVKPLGGSAGMGIGEASKVADRPALTNKCVEILRNFRQPALVEAYLPGREFTIGVAGNAASAHAIGAGEVHFRTASQDQPALKIRTADSDPLAPATGPLAEEATELAVRAWRALGCRDAGTVDIRCDVRGRPNFVEINPLPELEANSELVQLAGFKDYAYESLIGLILDEASGRVRP
jgi:D-alanine-D-alanine ligase